MLLSKRLDEAKLEAEEMDKRIRQLEKENKSLNRKLKVYQSIDSVSKVDILVNMAGESSMEPHEWVVMKVTEAIEADSDNAPAIPVPQDFHDKFEKLAESRGTTVERLAMSRNMKQWLNRGISNNRL